MCWRPGRLYLAPWAGDRAERVAYFHFMQQQCCDVQINWDLWARVPIPVQVDKVSFCENCSQAGPGSVMFWPKYYLADSLGWTMSYVTCLMQCSMCYITCWTREIHFFRWRSCKTAWGWPSELLSRARIVSSNIPGGAVIHYRRPGNKNTPCSHNASGLAE